MFNKIYRFIHKPWKREFRFFFQRMTRGWDDGQTFSLDYSLGKLIAPRLKRFKELTIGVPGDMTEQEWAEKLDKMIDFFEFAGSEYRWSAGPEEYDKHQEGLELFVKHYWNLWW
jgi:hypothetical protein